MKYLNIEKFDDTGIVKTLMVPKEQGRWRIYSHDIEANMEDLKYYKELGQHFGIEPKDMVRVPQVRGRGHGDDAGCGGYGSVRLGTQVPQAGGESDGKHPAGEVGGEGLEADVQEEEMGYAGCD